MAKGSNTRSSMLWEVERLLNETSELPQVLLMENVPEVASVNNINDFHNWQQFLESKGYSNYFELLKASDYGVAQKRKRAFMVSILGDYNYRFPEEIPLKKTMNDYLQKNVDAKYYITNEKANKLIEILIKNGEIPNKAIIQSGTDLTVNNPKLINQANCIKARYDSGISNLRQSGTGVLTREPRRIGGLHDGESRHQAGSAWDKSRIAPTLDTMGGGHREPMILDKGNQGINTKGKRQAMASTILAGYERSNMSGFNSDNAVLEATYRIRKLTPNECWRLMGFSDEDFKKAEKVNSNSQLYKQAGNSIVKNVLVAIISQLIPGKENIYKSKE